MRWLLTGIYTLAAVFYISGSFYFYGEERTARTDEAGAAATAHPEALLAHARDAMSHDDFSTPIRDVVLQSLDELPSFYQPPFFLAVYYANRWEEPETTQRAFEAALNRFPANGRLHLAYARWLFQARSIPPRETTTLWTDVVNPESLAERHLATAVELEPDLAREGLDVLRRRKVAPKRWVELLPDDEGVRTVLLTALFTEGHRDEALALLRTMIGRATDASFLGRASSYALRWGDPALALDAALRWRETERRKGGTSSHRHEAGFAVSQAQLELGESDAAYRTLRETLDEVGPSSPAGLELLCRMGQEYLNRQQVVSAQSLFAEAVTLAPRNVPALVGLARTYQRMGDDDEAIEQYRKALRVEPNHAEAERELARLLLR